ncbi:vacuolar sorting protein 39 domain 1-domain-containing protein [Mycena olivaceomarginata]|nr:vacuolar sorting protein 39 domain 1-domain-containing protein [Mycena olivaceomarginata]
MTPFECPTAVVSGLKEKITSLTAQDDRLYVGTTTGKLIIFWIDENVDGSDKTEIRLEIQTRPLSKAIDQIGIIKDINSLVLLSDAAVTLFPLPGLSPPTSLPTTKDAFSFAIHSSLQQILSGPQAAGVSVTQFIVGCRRKVMIYTWRDGEAQETKEASLPHSPRVISFLDKDTACFAYSATAYTIFSISTMVATSVSLPLRGTSGTRAFSALGGYMPFGLGAKSKPQVIPISESEALILKDNAGIFIGSDAKPTRTASVEWLAPPGEIAFLKPYIFSILPAAVPTAVIEVRSSISLLPIQTLALPFNHAASISTSSSTVPHPQSGNATIQLLMPSASSNSLFLVTAPIHSTAAMAEGSTIWQMRMKPWNAQINGLVDAGHYHDALALLNKLGADTVPDKEQQVKTIRGLLAVAQFRAGQFDPALKTFIALDVNPAKVIALYPVEVSGRLAVPQDAWISLFGGPVRPVAGEDSMASSTPSVPVFFEDDLPRAMRMLWDYLTYHRPRVAVALAAIGITPENQSHGIDSLSETSLNDLFALPDAPLSALDPEQLLHFAQIVDTALFESYLLCHPGLLGPLCRVPNWCEVSEVEEKLRARGKFAELCDLYNGMNMHGKALALLEQLSEAEKKMENKLSPSISYLRKLGPEHLDLIFASSRWIFEQDGAMAFQIFTSEDVELPRAAVADHLEFIDPKLCVRYLEFLVEERQEESIMFHDRLADSYLKMTLSGKTRNDEDWSQHYEKLLKFIDTTDRYTVERLYSRISSEDLFEARAILLGRLGRHDKALELYVYQLHDYLKAEEHCRRVYHPSTRASSIYLTLLRTYLWPAGNNGPHRLQLALELIKRNRQQMDAADTLQMLPPLVTIQDIRALLIGALRAPRFDTRVIRNLGKARADQVGRQLMKLQARRVKITESRICPQCHKRMGNSFIVVHPPRGQVTHYQCRKTFSRREK